MLGGAGDFYRFSNSAFGLICNDRWFNYVNVDLRIDYRKGDI